jgi:hypothetical protein
MGIIDETVELKSQPDLYTYWETNSTAKKVLESKGDI